MDEENPKSAKIKLEYLIKIIPIGISLLAFGVSLIALTRNNENLIPKFSLEVLKADENNKENLNRIFKIYNPGGQIVNPKIIPVMQLELDCITCNYGIPKKEGNLFIEFSDYFIEDYSFNNSESSFIITETKANELYDLMYNIDNFLQEDDIYINLFSIKYYFKISYYDYKGKHQKKIFYPMNNYAQIMFQEANRMRYFKNNELKEVNKINEPYMVCPMKFTDNGGAVTINEEDEITEILIEKGTNSDEYISFKIEEYLKKYSSKIEKSNYDEIDISYLSEYDWDSVYTLSNKKAKECIEVGENMVVGFIEEEKTDNKKNIFVLFAGFILMVIFIFAIIYIKKKKVRNKTNTND